MDTLAHYLWAVALYWYLRKDRKWLVGISGALPDLLSFGILIAMGIVTGSFGRGPPPVETIPQWLFSAYNVTHSLVVALLVVGILALVARRWMFLMYGWILHILCDIPTHTKAYFPTPFLWPLSSFKVSGISWGQWWFMLLNYAALAGVFTWLALRDRHPQETRKGPRKNAARR